MGAWAIAIARGCVLVPLFEERLFRGALLEWLRRYFSNRLAIVILYASEEPTYRPRSKGDEVEE
jgi:hypothetical protein